MQHDLRFIPFRSPADAGWDEAWSLYRDSFPPCERRSAEHHIRALADPAFTADGIWLGDRLAGLLFHWRGEGFRYAEHLAVAPALRGHNIGSRALEAYCRSSDVENPCHYIHPSYEEPFAPHPLVVMSYPEPLTPAQLRRAVDFVRERVLRYSGHEHPTLPRLEEAER